MWAAKREVFGIAELAIIACHVTAGVHTSSCCRIAPVSECQTMSRHCSSGAMKFGQCRFGSLPAPDSAVCLVQTLDQH